MKTRREYTTNNGIRLTVMKDESTGRFWWFNFRQKNKLIGNSDGEGNAIEFYEEIKKYLEEQK